MYSTFLSFAAIPGGGLGVLAGAVLVYLTKSKGRRLALIPWIVTFIALLPSLGFLFSCPNNNIAGIHTTLENRYLNRALTWQVVPALLCVSAQFVCMLLR